MHVRFLLKNDLIKVGRKFQNRNNYFKLETFSSISKFSIDYHALSNILPDTSRLINGKRKSIPTPEKAIGIRENWRPGGNSDDHRQDKIQEYSRYAL